ncbi:polysaccharide deacetylase family protein [Martelella sp. HB161492]|uniref:polysaccharide deacetylase family protein n=1 Tax=Martelella sp. HB161492 TaxID=2720726 RepID=UPI001FEFC788|nr:polysaccharide deacetylase family protein [Martelella sp. HB161492]
MRDFYGYGRDLPQVRWPGGARVAVSFVLNFEEGSEFAIGDGDDRNESVYEVIDGLPVADGCIQSHFEYGTRVGYWRIMELMEKYKARITVSACGRAAERSPWLVHDARERGHEIAAHGYRWESHAGLEIGEERQRIAAARQAIEAACGIAPVGWHTRSAASVNTRRLLVEAGFLYDSDAYNDDTPYEINIDGHRHLVLPYAFDTNDMQFQHTQRFSTGWEFATYVSDAFDWLWREGKTRPRMLSIGLHLRMIGRPGRIGALQTILSHMRRKGDVWIAPRAAIAAHWRAEMDKLG